jgi:hypothetical protein
MFRMDQTKVAKKFPESKLESRRKAGRNQLRSLEDAENGLQQLKEMEANKRQEASVLQQPKVLKGPVASVL